MKYTDVQKLHAAGLITDEQLQRIVAHFGLKEDSNRLLVIISFVGAVLVAASRASDPNLERNFWRHKKARKLRETGV